tara:strand:- start:6473 stop:6910 length:438 start_codon:yes stop_codon:yes gene_type:complete
MSLQKENAVEVEIPPINFKNKSSFHNLFEINSCNVSVIWIVYDKKRKIIISKGLSRPCGINHRRCSIHAEQKAIEYCRGNYNKNYEIYIWRYSKKGKIKHKYSCSSCTKLAHKYNFQNKIFTFYESEKYSAIIDNPPLSLCYEIL